MNASDARPARIRLAIALSIAAHLCALWLLAALLDERFIPLSSETDNGSTSFITTIEHRMHAAVASGRRVGAARPARTPAALAERRPAALPSTPIPNPAARLHGKMMLASTVRPTASSGANAPPGTSSPRHSIVPQRPTLALVEATEAPTSTPTAAPTPKPAVVVAPPTSTPAPTRSPPAVVAASFGGLFSADYPPALAAPSDVAGVSALLNGPARIRIEVDETGQATAVRFVIPVSDPQIERAVREKLLALHYVPADCNGLHCEGTLELRL